MLSQKKEEEQEAEMRRISREKSQLESEVNELTDLLEDEKDAATALSNTKKFEKQK